MCLRISKSIGYEDQSCLTHSLASFNCRFCSFCCNLREKKFNFLFFLKERVIEVRTNERRATAAQRSQEVDFNSSSCFLGNCRCPGRRRRRKRSDFSFLFMFLSKCAVSVGINYMHNYIWAYEQWFRKPDTYEINEITYHIHFKAIHNIHCPIIFITLLDY